MKIQRVDLKTQVKEALHSYIQTLDLSKSNKLPREEELASMLGVSRITLRSALDDMAADGIIFRRQGKGTFVNPTFFEMKVSFNPVMHFSDMIINSGYQPSTRLLRYEIQPASKEVAKVLQLGDGEKVIVCTKVFFADNHLCALVEDYLPLSLVEEKDVRDLEKYSDSMFYFLHQKTGRKIMWDKVEIDVADSREVPVLHQCMREYGSEDKAFLFLKGVNYDESDREVLYALEYIDTDILKFNQIRKRSIVYCENENGQ